MKEPEYLQKCKKTFTNNIIFIYLIQLRSVFLMGQFIFSDCPQFFEGLPGISLIFSSLHRFSIRFKLGLQTVILSPLRRKMLVKYNNYIKPKSDRGMRNLGAIVIFFMCSNEI